MEDLGTVLEQVTRSVWGTTLGLSLGRVAGDPVPEWNEAPIVASVDIDGDWNGSVMLACSPKTARRVAKLLFGERSPEPTRGDLEDAVGELVNMTSGNMKSCLGARCRLSLPATGPAARARGGSDERRTFDCEGEIVILSIRESL